MSTLIDELGGLVEKWGELQRSLPVLSPVGLTWGKAYSELADILSRATSGEVSGDARDAARYRCLRIHADARGEDFEEGPCGTMLVGYAGDEDICSSSDELDRMVDAALESLTTAHKERT